MIPTKPDLSEPERLTLLNELRKRKIPDKTCISQIDLKEIYLQLHALTIYSLTTADKSKKLSTDLQIVYTVLNKYGIKSKVILTKVLLAIAESREDFFCWKQSGFLNLLVKVYWAVSQGKAGKVVDKTPLFKAVHFRKNEVKRRNREIKILRLLESVRLYCDCQRQEDSEETVFLGVKKFQLGGAMVNLKKISSNEDYTHALVSLHGLQTMFELLEITTRFVGIDTNFNQFIRSHACEIITNMIKGKAQLKGLVLSEKKTLDILLDQVKCQYDSVIEAAAVVVRILCSPSQMVCYEVGAVTALMNAAMTVKKDVVCESLLSAVKGFSFHHPQSVAEICNIDGSVQFLVGLHTNRESSKITEHSLGILQNLSTQNAIRENCRKIVSEAGCCQILSGHANSNNQVLADHAGGILLPACVENNTFSDVTFHSNSSKNCISLIVMQDVAVEKDKIINVTKDNLNIAEQHDFEAGHDKIKSETNRNLTLIVMQDVAAERDKIIDVTKDHLNLAEHRNFKAELDKTRLSETNRNVTLQTAFCIMQLFKSGFHKFVYNINQMMSAFCNDNTMPNSSLHFRHDDHFNKKPKHSSSLEDFNVVSLEKKRFLLNIVIHFFVILTQ